MLKRYLKFSGYGAIFMFALVICLGVGMTVWETVGVANG